MRKRGVWNQRKTLGVRIQGAAIVKTLLCSQDIVHSEGRGREVDTLSYSVPGDPEALGTKKEDPQEVEAIENSNSIMSFFKTLVSRCLWFASLMSLSPCLMMLECCGIKISIRAM